MKDIPIKKTVKAKPKPKKPTTRDTITRTTPKEVMASPHKRTNIYNISNLPFGLGGSSSRTYTKLSSQVTSVTFKRTMMVNCRILQHAARAIYHCAGIISHDDLFKGPKSAIPTQVADGMVTLALNPQTGISQHHTKILRHLIGHQFRSEDIFNAFLEKLKKDTNINIEIFKNEPHTLVDARVINEITSIVEYTKRFFIDIDWLLFTNDARPASFPNQHQSNQDFWVMLKTKYDPSMGVGYKCVPQDEKSGGDMFHSCRGSLGTLTYEQNGTLVPFMNQEVNLTAFNRKRIRSIQDTLTPKKIDLTLHNDLEIYKEKFNAIKNERDVFQLNEDLQTLLWHNIQRNPLYTRSMSFIFTRHVEYHPFNEKQNNFANHFKSLLVKDRYDLDNVGDCREIYRAMTIAYTKNVDSQFATKMMYLHHEAGFKMNTHFLHEIAKLIKDGLL